jgi:hypothetical protein
MLSAICDFYVQTLDKKMFVLYMLFNIINVTVCSVLYN